MSGEIEIQRRRRRRRPSAMVDMDTSFDLPCFGLKQAPFFSPVIDFFTLMECKF